MAKKKKSNFFSELTEKDIRVSYIDPILGLVNNLTICEAKGAGSGDIRIRGLPFTTSTSPDFAGANCDVFYNNAATSWVNLKAGATSANTQLYVYGQTAATTNTIREGNFTASDINSNFEIRCSITYRV